MPEEETDLVDFVFDNADTITESFGKIKSYSLDLYHTLPNMLGSFLGATFSFLGKVFMRLRAHAVMKMTQDMNMLDNDKRLWDQIDKGYALKLLKVIKRKTKVEEEQKICHNLRVLIYTNQKDKFLAYCIEKQNEPFFCKVKDNLVKKK